MAIYGMEDEGKEKEKGGEIDDFNFYDSWVRLVESHRATKYPTRAITFEKIKSPLVLKNCCEYAGGGYSISSFKLNLISKYLEGNDRSPRKLVRHLKTRGFQPSYLCFLFSRAFKTSTSNALD